VIWGLGTRDVKFCCASTLLTHIRRIEVISMHISKEQGLRSGVRRTGRLMHLSLGQVSFETFFRLASFFCTTGIRCHDLSMVREICGHGSWLPWVSLGEMRSAVPVTDPSVFTPTRTNALHSQCSLLHANFSPHDISACTGNLAHVVRFPPVCRT